MIARLQCAPHTVVCGGMQMTSTESIRDSLVRLFTSNPEAEFHMRGIGRLLGKEPGVFQRAINALVDEGILEDEYRANARFFSLSGTHQPVSERGGSRFDQEYFPDGPRLPEPAARRWSRQ